MIDIFVINLKHRKNRLDLFNFYFSKHFNINVTDAIKDKEGWKGCLNSHLKCIQYAKDNNLKYIIVFEDDAAPLNGGCEKLKKIAEEVFEKKNNWDIYLGGSIRIYQKSKIKKYDLKNDIFRIHAAKSTYCIVYNHTCYDFFLNCDKKKPIDTLWHKKINCIASIPYLFTCSNTKSDISGTWQQLNRMIENDEKINLEYIKTIKENENEDV